MIRSTDGVAGFFEDLPVLAFVLSGVALIMGSIIWSSQQLNEKKVSEDLEELARRVADYFGELAMGGTDDTTPPSVRHISSLNITSGLAQLLNGRHCAVSARMLYPELRWLTSVSFDSSHFPSDVASASRMLNALDDEGRHVVIEVIVAVW